MLKKILLFLILLVSVGSVSFLFKSNDVKEKKLDINSTLVQELYQKVVPNDAIYIQKQFYTDGLTNEYKINIGILNLVKENHDQDFLLANDVERSMQEILGKNVTMNHQTIYFYINGFCGYEFNEKENRYEPFNGCGGVQLEFFHKKIISAEEVEEKIILKEQLVYADLEPTGFIKNLYIYNNPQQDKLLDSISDYQGDYMNDGEKYINQGSVYIYTFMKEDGKFVLEKIEKE